MDDDASRTPDTQPKRRARLVMVVGMGLALTLGAAAAGVIAKARSDAWAGATAAAGNVNRALAKDVDRNLSLLGLSMQGVGEALSEPGIASVPSAIRRRALFDKSMEADYLGSILIFGPDGRIVEDSTSVVPHPVDLSDRDYFRVHAANAGLGTYISRPFSSRMRNGEMSITVSRRLPDVDGKFSGVVAGALRLAYFRDLFSKMDVGRNGTITLLRDDGTLIARHPYRDSDVGRDMSSAGPFLAMRGKPSGAFTGTSVTDGVERMFTFSRVGNFPLILSVGLAVADIDAGWASRAIMIGSVVAAMAIAMMVFSAMVARQMAKCEAAERRVALANEVLRVQASTDPLTGLANRRTYEQALEREWRRSERAGTPTPMLVIDADKFKLYNDANGHDAGDRVLKSVADALSKSLLRPGDLAVRFGGEEFVALLPNTDLPGAAAVAERVVAAVRGLAIPHRDGVGGVVTVSVGLATMSSASEFTAGTLFAAADRAVYEAKNAGRDRVRIAGGLLRIA